MAGDARAQTKVLKRELKSETQHLSQKGGRQCEFASEAPKLAIVPRLRQSVLSLVLDDVRSAILVPESDAFDWCELSEFLAS
jgi:hypothetical protein